MGGGTGWGRAGALDAKGRMKRRSRRGLPERDLAGWSVTTPSHFLVSASCLFRVAKPFVALTSGLARKGVALSPSWPRLLPWGPLHLSCPKKRAFVSGTALDGLRGGRRAIDGDSHDPTPFIQKVINGVQGTKVLGPSDKNRPFSFQDLGTRLGLASVPEDGEMGKGTGERAITRKGNHENGAEEEKGGEKKEKKIGRGDIV